MQDYLNRPGQKKRIHQQELILLERQLLLQQQRGIIRPCFQPSLEEADRGTIYWCQLKDAINKFCPECVIFRQKISALRYVRAKKAQQVLVDKINVNNLEVLTREVSQLMQTNTQLMKEVTEKQRLITDLFTINSELSLTIKKGTQELQQQYAKRKKLEELIIEAQHHVTTVSAQLRVKKYRHHGQTI